MSRRGRNEGSIYQRKDGRWVGTVDLGWHDGRRVRRSVYGQKRSEVNEKLTHLQRAISGGLSPAPARLTVSTYLVDQWLPQARTQIRASTYLSYAGIVRLHLVPSLGQIPLAKLSVDQVESMMRRKGETLSPRRVAMIRATLRRALRGAVRRRLIADNVAALADPPKQERYRVQPFDQAEAKAFLEAVRGHQYEAAYVTALMTGMRSGELRGLTWDDVDLENRRITVNMALHHLEGTWERLAPKTEKSQREMPMPATVAELLTWHRIRQDHERELLGQEWGLTARGWRTPWPLVFTTSHGTPIDDANFGRDFHAVVRRAGIRRPVRLHDLRHSAATFWLAAGVPARVVQELLGHSTITLTMNTYTHVMDSMLVKAADAMDRAFGDAAHAAQLTATASDAERQKATPTR